MFLVCEKTVFSAYEKPTGKEKSFSQHTRASTSHRTQTNVQSQISSVKTYCELAERLLFFETSQSCVSTIATLSHRFKSSPAIPGKLAVPGAAGYMMNAGHFRKSYVSSRDLNRPRESRGSQPSGVLLVLFVQAKRINPFSLAGRFEVFQTSKQLTAMAVSHEQN